MAFVIHHSLVLDRRLKQERRNVRKKGGIQKANGQMKGVQIHRGVRVSRGSLSAIWAEGHQMNSLWQEHQEKSVLLEHNSFCFSFGR